MAYTIAAGSILQLTCRYRLTSTPDEALTTHHYQLVNLNIPDGAAEAVAAAQEFMTVASRWGQLWRAVSSNLVELHDVWAQWIYPIRYQKQDANLPSLSGTINSPPAPPGTSVALERRGDKANKHNVGGVRVPGAPMDIAGDGSGQILGGYVAAWNALASTLNDSWSTALNPGSSYIPVIYNRAAPTTSAPVTNVILHQTVRTMRRRVVGRGT